MKKLKFIDMFAGIGGFHSGLEQAGMQCDCTFSKRNRGIYCRVSERNKR